ncbi:MAG: hypothetical protein HQM01_02100 [Magnetococcales bacterium]|nr:hypothetical protein [Magnetococcales bacterium]
MSSKINIAPIFSGHLATLKNHTTGKTSYYDMFVFFVIPIIFGSLSLLCDIKLSSQASSILITALSIFSGLLINVLVLIYSVYQNIPSIDIPEDQNQIEMVKLEKRILQETFSNISFANLIAIIIVIIVSIMESINIGYQEIISSFIIVALIHFTLTILMVLKRIHILIGHKMNQTPQHNPAN